MDYRIERDSLGEIEVPSDKNWGAVTERSRRNFKIGGQLMPKEIIRALVLVKKCAAVANFKAGKLPQKKKDAIVSACEKILRSDDFSDFPLVVWQTGSGTQTNMNVNEVIANLCKKDTKENPDSFVHPNDDVNMSQSTNDVFPTAMHVAAVLAAEDKLIPQIQAMIKTAKRLEDENKGIKKVGRTHLMDAVPIDFSSEVSGWCASLETSLEMIFSALKYVKRLAIGGTAVGNGLNAPADFGSAVVWELNEQTGKDFCEDENKFHALSSRDGLLNFHGALKTLAANLNKIANDVRWLASGPRAGLSEITIPENEPGSSIMPGKVNPTQCEALTMIFCEVLGNDVAIGAAASAGNFELNVYMPLIAFKTMESINLLTDGISSFDKNCFSGIKANAKKMREYLSNSLMCATALTPYIGYSETAKLVQYAHRHDLSIYEANEALKVMDGKKLKDILDKALGNKN
jgi:fumarate hydratase class II